jgi:hypothetical protein
MTVDRATAKCNVYDVVNYNAKNVAYRNRLYLNGLLDSGWAVPLEEAPRSGLLARDFGLDELPHGRHFKLCDAKISRDYTPEL